MKFYINDDWSFVFEYTDAFAKGRIKGEEIRIPHTVKELAYSYCTPQEYETVAGYKRKINYLPEFKNKRVFINFDGVGHLAEVYFNNELLGTHKGGFTSFKYEITDLLKTRGNNILLVKVDTRESLNIPPFGNTIDYLCYGGIYRDVYLTVEDYAYLDDVYSATYKENGEWYLKSTLHVDGQLNGSEEVFVEVLENDKLIARSQFSALLDTNLIELGSSVHLWSIDDPFLYKIRYRLLGQVYENNVGIREAKFEADGFYLNGEKLKFIGLNRHQSYPYVGYAMCDSVQIEDAHILKEELGVQVVRTSHYPQSKRFIEECDKIGLLVVTEIPGWQHIGDKSWQEQFLKDVRDMIVTYRNHPSIILWGVRINESQDNDELYSISNELAHKLDPYRQTTGIRYLTGSSLLEDVYAHNDFSFDGDINKPGLKTKKNAVKKDKSMQMGYFVSEYNGHMFPTKSFDDEIHKTEHALRHARVLNSMYSQADIAGCIGWCMFDYNTHSDFGSGDRICHHGVLDMFRNKKLAASVYASQTGDIDVLEISSSMNIGDYPAGYINKVWVFTNADSVKLYKNDEFVKEFLPSQEFSAMPHPPIMIDDFIGDLIKNNEVYSEKVADEIKLCLQEIARVGVDNISFKYKLKMAKLMIINHISLKTATDLYNKYVSGWGGNTNGYRFDAIKDGKVVKSVVKAPANKLHLDVSARRNILVEENSYDAELINIRVIDQNDNVCEYYMDTLRLKTEGAIELIGPDVISLKGGQFGTFVKSKGRSGKGKLTIENDYLEPITLEFSVKCKKYDKKA